MTFRADKDLDWEIDMNDTPRTVDACNRKIAWLEDLLIDWWEQDGVKQARINELELELAAIRRHRWSGWGRQFDETNKTGKSKQETQQGT
jgi:hypothetical protein